MPAVWEGEKVEGYIRGWLQGAGLGLKEEYGLGGGGGKTRESVSADC